MTAAEREGRLLDVAQGVVRASAADETEVVLMQGRSFLTRFSRNRIHQNVGSEDAWAMVRVSVGKRLGVATASSLEASALAEARAAALAIARASEPVPDWPGLPPPRPLSAVDGWDAATAEASADQRADLAAAIIAAARAKDGEAAGAIETENGSIVVASSTGVAAHASQTRAEINACLTSGDGSGYAEGVSTRLGDLRAEAIGRRAARKARLSRNPKPLPPGRYDVVLEPPALAEWLGYLAYVAFGGKEFDEGRGPLSGKLGRKVTGEAVTIWDSGLDRRTLPMPFDFEGMPKRRLAIITRGAAKAVTTNHYRARRMGKRRSSGHALPASSGSECMPMHLFMQGGTSSARALVAGLKRGLLVTRFWYTNVLEPMRTVLTGMTRDGTFLVEDGEVVAPVRNLRYTENILEALGRIEGLSRRLALVRGPVVVPTALVRQVQFSGATQF